MWCGVSFFFVCMVCRGQKTDVHLSLFCCVCLCVCFVPPLDFGTGKKELVKYVNCIDSHGSKVTPLLEACRTRVGFMEDRISVLHMLLKNGANLRAKDIHGDNCVHWAARTGSLPVVRYLLKNTEGAVWASMDENILRKRPIDLALEQCCERVVVLNRNENEGTGKSNEFVVPLCVSWLIEH